MMELPPRRLPPKREVVLDMLERGSLRLFIDPRREGVDVPKKFLAQAELVLRIGLELSPPIPDLAVGEDSISCKLTFNGLPHVCVLPLAAVFAAIPDVDGRGVVWPEDVPIESELLRPRPDAEPRRTRAAARLSGQGRPGDGRARTGARPAAAQQDGELRSRPALQVRSDGDSDGESNTPPHPTKTRLKLPPYLRVVK